MARRSVVPRHPAAHGQRGAYDGQALSVGLGHGRSCPWLLGCVRLGRPPPTESSRILRSQLTCEICAQAHLRASFQFLCRAKASCLASSSCTRSSCRLLRCGTCEDLERLRPSDKAAQQAAFRRRHGAQGPCGTSVQHPKGPEYPARSRYAPTCLPTLFLVFC